MKNIFYNLFLCFFVLFGYVDRINGCEYIENSDDSLYWDIYPDTWVATDALAYIIHSGFISGYQNRYGDNLKPPTNVYHRMTA